jgi:hypothetical protein
MNARQHDFGHTLGETFREVAAAFDDLGSTLEPGSRRPPFDREAEERQDALKLGDEVRNPLELVSLAVLARKAAIVDYLRGLGTLARYGARPGELQVFSLAPVARAALEAISTICWLADPDIDGEERVRRMCCDVAHDLRSRARVVSAARLGGVEPNMDSDALINMCETYGVEYKWGKPDAQTDVRTLHIVGEARPSAFQTMHDLMPSAGAPALGAIFYNLVSDVAHGSLQGLLGRARQGTDEDGSLRLDISREGELRQVAPVVFAVTPPARLLARFYGWDGDAFVARYTAATDRLTQRGYGQPM